MKLAPPHDHLKCLMKPSNQIRDNGIESLTSIFPSASRETVRNSLLTYQNIELAAEALSESSVKKEVKDEDVHQILNRLTVHETIHVFFHFYKCKNFDPQPAVNTGACSDKLSIYRCFCRNCHWLIWPSIVQKP